MTDAEIFAVISNSRGQVCGRFQDNQLNRLINPPVSPRKNFLPTLLLTAGLITGIANHSYAEARDLEQMEMLLTPVPEDTVAKPMKTYNLPEVQVVAYETIRKCTYSVGAVMAVSASDLQLSADGKLIDPKHHPDFVDQVYPTDEERRRTKKKRWF